MEQVASVAYGCLQWIAPELPMAVGLKSRDKLIIMEWGLKANQK
jgi:hypothetical protein